MGLHELGKFLINPADSQTEDVSNYGKEHWLQITNDSWEGDEEHVCGDTQSDASVDGTLGSIPNWNRL